MLQVNQGLHKWASDQDMTKHVGPDLMDLSILDRATLEIFESYNIANLRILHVPITRFFSLFLSYLLQCLLSNVHLL